MCRINYYPVSGRWPARIVRDGNVVCVFSKPPSESDAQVMTAALAAHVVPVTQHGKYIKQFGRELFAVYNQRGRLIGACDNLPDAQKLHDLFQESGSVPDIPLTEDEKMLGSLS